MAGREELRRAAQALHTPRTSGQVPDRYLALSLAAWLTEHAERPDVDPAALLVAEAIVGEPRE